MSITQSFAPCLTLALLLLGGCPPIDPDGGTGSSDAGPAASDAGIPVVDASPDTDAGPAPAPAIGARVSTESGDVLGVASDDLVSFEGIPYAAPPVGALRWQPPAPALPFEGGELDASAPGPVCRQGDAGDREGSEDCLTLNVYAPRAEGSRPVMVFIHGGSFISGSGSYDLYEGTDLGLHGDVVVVTINYRLGALGYLAHEALAAEGEEGSVGNYGLRDQIAALEWVQRNIAAFGGDPDQVTVFGESAGAISICALLGSPLADGLYHRAALQSGGGCFGFIGPRDGASTRMAQGAELVRSLGCDGASDPLACARAASADAVLDFAPAAAEGLSTDLYAGMTWGPVIDGVVLPEDPGARITAGAEPDVPVIIGINRDEASLFTLGIPVNFFNYRAQIAAVVGETVADDVVALYPIAEYGSARAAFNAAGTDLLVGCDTERFALTRNAGSHPTYLYEFTQTLGGLLEWVGATHALELPFVFGNFDPLVPRPEDLAVSATMQTAWTSFAHDGAPTMTPEWPLYAAGEASVAVIDEPATVTATWRGGKCEALRSLGLVE